LDTFLGLLGIVVYIVAVLALAAGVTFTVIRLSPARSGRKPKPSSSEES
jgi:hypothetical protein